MTEYDKITECIVGGADPSEISDILFESMSKEESTQMDYLLKMEEYLDNCGVYAFDGWEEGMVKCAPRISDFWFEIDLIFKNGVDLDGAKRLMGKNQENTVKIKKGENGVTLRLRILRNLLDKIETEHRKNAAKAALAQGGDETPVNQQPSYDTGGFE